MIGGPKFKKIGLVTLTMQIRKYFVIPRLTLDPLDLCLYTKFDDSVIHIQNLTILASALPEI